MTPPSDGAATRGGPTGAVASRAAAPRMGAMVGAPYAEQTSFRRGLVLQDRFKILRFIAKGGAGEVYEAQDLELRCPVALKVARPEITDNESAIERFRREIALARQVTHPNVCRIFDVFRHEIPAPYPGGRARQTLFLTMELLNGESLAARLQRLGPMKPQEAMPLVEGMVAGLAAAHRVGVIHRDFKSANVVLVEEMGSTRAVITDFGLARGALPDPSSEDLTVSGTVVGTPNYMAPEQLTGGEITAAVDTYALGIVLYETMTGTRPFIGESDLSTAVKRLTEPPPSPRLHAPDLQVNWERAILRCLERDPKDRFPSLSDLPRVLRGEIDTAAPPSLQRKRRRSFAIGAGVVLAAVLIAALVAGALRDRATLLPAPTSGTPTVAVLDFHNLAGTSDAAYLGSAMAEMVGSELAASGASEPVPRDSVSRAVADLGIASSSGIAPETLERLRRALGSDLVVEGAYLRLPDGSLRIQMRVHDRAGSIYTVTEQGTEALLFDMVARAATKLRDLAGLAGKTPAGS